MDLRPHGPLQRKFNISIIMNSLSNKWRLPIVLFFMALVLAAATLRCGETKKKDTAKATQGTSNLPTDWDGTSDWSGSALQVVDE